MVKDAQMQNSIRSLSQIGVYYPELSNYSFLTIPVKFLSNETSTLEKTTMAKKKAKKKTVKMAAKKTAKKAKKRKPAKAKKAPAKKAKKKKKA